MSVFEEIENIPEAKLASDMPGEFAATLLSATKKDGEFGPSLKFELQTEDGATFSTSYRIPKKLTGKGQMDLLLKACAKLKLHLADMVGKKFRWKAEELSGPMKGHPRHYPVALIEEKLDVKA